jgi:hypothetical protein
MRATCSGVWVPPPKYHHKEACNQEYYLNADLYPVPDRRGISVSDPIRPVRPVEKPVEKINMVVVVLDFSFDKAMPQFAAAIDAQIDRDDASDDFI